MLPVNRIGENPQQPSINAETFIPDQLIAGDLKLVTDNQAVITGAALYVRGTVMGQILEAAAASAAGVQATGTFTFSGNPAVNETVTLNGTAVTFIANDTAPVGNQVALGLTEAATIEALESFLNASTDTQIVKFTFSAVGQVLTATAVAGGTAGNALTIATTSAVIAVSGGTLAGGAANTGTGTITGLGVGSLPPKNGTYKLKCFQATTGIAAATVTPDPGNIGTASLGTVTPGAGASLGDYLVQLTSTGATAAFNVYAPGGALVGAGHIGTLFNAGGISFTATTGGTPTAGDSYVVDVTDTGVALFSVTDPAGGARPNATVGTAYSDQIAFTINQGGTKFVVGDTFSVRVGLGSGKYTLCVATATDGSQVPAGILVDQSDSTGGDVAGGVYLMGEFNQNAITFDPSWTIPTLKAALSRSGIFLKAPVSANDAM